MSISFYKNLIKIDCLLTQEEAGTLAALLREEIQKYTVDAALALRLGEVSQVYFDTCAEHAKYLEELANQVFPGWSKD